jgi:predicted RNA binding protein YcfA (HicA-like mRNA interferase family)
MPRKQDEVEKSLLKKGFLAGGGDHNFFFYHSKAGKKTIVRTKTSHGGKDIDDNLLSQMAKQCKLTNKDFGQLIDCPLSRDDYEVKLVAAGAVEPPPALQA